MLFRRLLNALVGAMPDSLRETAAPADQDNAAVMELFKAHDPSNAAEIQLAAIAIAAGFSTMDSLLRGLSPSTTEPTAAGLRSSGLTAARTLETAMRLLQKPPEAPAAARRPQPDPEPVAPVEIPPGHIALRPGATPIPLVETFQPRDRFGAPIPLHRTDLMTRAQLLAALTYPRDPALDAAAIAEEEAMIAEQRQRSGS